MKLAILSPALSLILIASYASDTKGDPLREIAKTPPGGRSAKAFEIDWRSKGYDAGYLAGERSAKRKIAKLLCENSDLMDRAFPLATFFIDGILSPPVIAEKRIAAPENGGKIYIRKEKVYTIVKKARFVDRPPTWEDVLGIDCRKETEGVPKRRKNFPNESAKTGYEKGFSMGYRDAFETTMKLMRNRLDAMDDFVDGAAVYFRLYYGGKISPPRIATIAKNVEVEKDKMEIGTRKYEIIENAKFRPHPKTWRNFYLKNVGNAIVRGKEEK